MSEKDFDYLLPHVHTDPVEVRGYVWKVITDPTRTEDDPGLFLGSLFRMIDIRLNRDEKSTWPDGIVFEQINTGCRLAYQGGVLMDLTNSKVIQKKPRVRDRSRKPKNMAAVNAQSLANHPLPASSGTQLRRFILVRSEDVTGASGTGNVAEGTVFSSGRAVINWLKEPFAMGIYQTIEDVILVHGHEGRTQIRFID